MLTDETVVQELRDLSTEDDPTGIKAKIAQLRLRKNKVSLDYAIIKARIGYEEPDHRLQPNGWVVLAVTIVFMVALLNVI